MKANVNHLLFKDWRHFLSLGFGAGLSPVAPGTFGTLMAFPLYYLLHLTTPVIGWTLIILFSIVGVYVCDYTAKVMQTDDPSAVVWDEIVAFLVFLLWVTPQGIGYLWAFLLFRLFDIWKPYPICWADRHVKGGWGIMLDDFLAMLFGVGVWFSLEGLIVGF